MEPLLLPWLVARKRKLKDESKKAVIPSKQFHIAPQFRLIYYNARGPVEVTRMILAYSGIPFEDIRLKTEKQWTQAVKSSPNKDLPILEWNTKKLCDGDAITRMLAKMYGLAGYGIFEQAQADAIYGTIKDFVNAVIEYVNLKLLYLPFTYNSPKPSVDDEVKSKDLKTFYFKVFEPAVQKYFGILEYYASQSSSDFFLSSGISYVDFAVTYLYEFLQRMHPELMEKYFNIKAITKKVSRLPQLEIYLENRPEADW